MDRSTLRVEAILSVMLSTPFCRNFSTLLAWSVERRKAGPGEPLQSLSDELSSCIAGLRRYALSLAGNSVDADDLVQEALQRGLAAIRDGRKIHNLRSYLFTILHNVRMSQLRQGNAYDHVSLSEFELDLPSAANQEQVVELKELLVALSELPMEQKAVVLLVCLEGFSYRQTAEILGVPIGTVMSRLSRSRRLLMKETMTTESPRVAETG